MLKGMNNAIVCTVHVVNMSYVLFNHQDLLVVAQCTLQALLTLSAKHLPHTHSILHGNSHIMFNCFVLFTALLLRKSCVIAKPNNDKPWLEKYTLIIR